MTKICIARATSTERVCCAPHTGHGPGYIAPFSSSRQSEEIERFLVQISCKDFLTSITLDHMLFNPPWKTALYRTGCIALETRTFDNDTSQLSCHMLPVNIPRALYILDPSLHDPRHTAPDLRPEEIIRTF